MSCGFVTTVLVKGDTGQKPSYLSFYIHGHSLGDQRINNSLLHVVVQVFPILEKQFLFIVQWLKKKEKKKKKGSNKC